MNSRNEGERLYCWWNTWVLVSLRFFGKLKIGILKGPWMVAFIFLCNSRLKLVNNHSWFQLKITLLTWLWFSKEFWIWLFRPILEFPRNLSSKFKVISTVLIFLLLFFYRLDLENQERCGQLTHERLTEPRVTMEWLLAKPNSSSYK